jgi:F-type H+-transporting ATPase subunit gamma
VVWQQKNKVSCFFRSDSVVMRKLTRRSIINLVWNQIQATKNLSKITGSMKMVSAAKLKGDENRLARAKPFNAWTSKLNPEPKLMDPDTTFEELPNKVLIVPFTSEKGLCGGVNSYISRSVKLAIKKLHAAGKDADVCVIGDKGRAQMKRAISEKIKISMTDVIAPGSFGLASSIASELIAAGAKDYDAIVLMYNSYVNAATYYQKYKVITPFVTQVEQESMEIYDFDTDKAEAVEDMYEFLLASQVYHSFMDGAAAEQSSRMTAMENASKNAGEMVASLTLRYNRARQARITTELIEIISGASALDG